MKNSSILILLYIDILIATVTVHCEDENYFEDTLNSEELIDPHSFFYDKQSKTMMQDTRVRVVADDAEENNSDNQDKVKLSKERDNYSNHEVIFYKRLINLLLSNINIKEQDETSITGILEIEVSHSQMEVLRNFHISKTSLREIDEILSTIIKKPQYSYMTEVWHLCEMLQKLLGFGFKVIQEYPDGAVIAFAMLMVCWTLKMIRWGQRLPIFTIIQVIFILSFFMTWWQLIQEAEVKFAAAQMKFSSIPISCQPHKMNIWDKFVSFFSNDDCEQYYRTVMSNSKLKITPAFALSHFITTVVLHPLTHVGTVISEFIANATDNLPWAYGWIVRCMLFLCIGFVILIIPFCLSGASIDFGVGPLLRFGISHQKGREKGNSLHSIEKREPVQIILKVPPCIEMQEGKNKSGSEQLQSNLESDIKALPIAKCDSQKPYGDLSCGDTIENIKSSKYDDDDKPTELDAMDIAQKDGSGDG